MPDGDRRPGYHEPEHTSRQRRDAEHPDEKGRALREQQIAGGSCRSRCRHRAERSRALEGGRSRRCTHAPRTSAGPATDPAGRVRHGVRSSRESRSHSRRRRSSAAGGAGLRTLPGRCAPRRPPAGRIGMLSSNSHVRTRCIVEFSRSATAVIDKPSRTYSCRSRSAVGRCTRGQRPLGPVLQRLGRRRELGVGEPTPHGASALNLLAISGADKSWPTASMAPHGSWPTADTCATA